MPLSLIEQKKLQWAKEKEELDGLWSPWGKPKPPGPDRSSLSLDNSGKYKSGSGAVSPDFTRTKSSGKSRSECHLPPIGKPQTLGSPQHGNSKYGEQYYYRDSEDYAPVPVPIQRKASLPVCVRCAREERQQQGVNHMNSNVPSSKHYAYYDNDNEHTSGYFSENNGFEEGYFRTGNEKGRPDLRSDQISFKTPEPPSYVSRFAAEDKTDNYGLNDRSMMARNFEGAHTHRSVATPAYNYNTNEPPQYDYSYQKSRSQPPPPAMRSSFLVGVDGPQAEILNKELEKQEKQNWLHELEQQREMDRKKKEMEREEKRARWGDKGIGVGHFWEPSSANSHLPISPSSRDENQFHSPAWLEKSLNNVHSSAKSQSSHCLNDSSACLETQFNAQTMSSSSRSVSDLKFIGFGASNLEQNSLPLERTFLLGHNVQADPEALAEKQRKQQAAMEHHEAVRRQIEERQVKLKQDHERELAEEIREENRIAASRLKELQRLEMEKRNAHIRAEQSKEENLESNTEIFLPIQRNDRQTKILQDNENYRSSYVKPGRTDAAIEAQVQIETKEKQTSPFPDAELPEFIPRISQSLKIRDGSSYSRDCGIQTEPETDKIVMKKPSNVNSMEQQQQSPSKIKIAAKGNTKTATAEPSNSKPRWGATPPKKQYVKQSEKDPTYQLKIKKRLERAKQMQKQRAVNIDTNSDSEDKGQPQPRPVQGSRRIETQSRLPLVSNGNGNSNVTSANLKKTNPRSRLPKIEPEPKIELLSAAAPIEFEGSIWQTSEDESGAILSTPSLGSIYNSNSDLVQNGHDDRLFKSSSLSELESLTNIRYGDENRREPEPVTLTRDFSSSSSEFEKEPLFTNTTKYYPEPEENNRNCFVINQQEQQRCVSPPVPAVLRKIRAGLHPIDPQFDEFILRERSPFTPVSSPRYFNASQSHSPRINDQISGRSSVPKSEINYEIPEFENYGSSLTVPDGRGDQVISPRSFSINRGEQLITQIMNTREIQHQLSARSSELTQEGIIKFSVTVPSFQQQQQQQRDRNSNPQEVYKDPLISEKENSTIRWLYSTNQPTSSVLTHLSSLKKGIQNQQQEWGLPVEEV